MSRRIVAIVNYRSSKGILNVVQLLERLSKKGKVRPREWKGASKAPRSLLIYDDGSCRLEAQSTASIVRKLAATLD